MTDYCSFGDYVSMGRRITNGSAQVSDMPVIQITKPNDIFTAQTRERDYE